MARKRKKVDPELEREIKEVNNWYIRQYERQPVVMDPENPTSEEEDAIRQWDLNFQREAEDFLVNSRLTPEELKAKYERSPEADKEIQELERQERLALDAWVKSEERGDPPEECFQLEEKMWQIRRRKWENCSFQYDRSILDSRNPVHLPPADTRHGCLVKQDICEWVKS